MAIPPVTIEFLAKNAPQIAASFRTVANAIARLEQQAVRDTERGSKARQSASEREGKARVASVSKAESDARRIQERSTADAVRQYRAQERAIDQAARAKVRIESQAAREVERIQERAHRSAVAMVKKEEQERLRAAAGWVRQQEKLQNVAALNSRRTVNTFGNAAASGVRAGGGKIAGLATQTAGIAATLGGGFSIAGSVTEQSNLRSQAAVLAASTQMADAGKRRIGGDEIYSKAKDIGIRQGIDTSDVLKGFDEIKKLTGDLDQAMRIMPGVARLATATGGNVGEMSGLAANILAANPNMADADVDKQMRVFTRQGVVGGVEVADFAKYGSRLTAGASLFGGEGSKNLATMGAFAQISRQYGGAASASEAALASQRFATDVASHSGVLKKQGIDVSDKHGNLRDAQSIITDMVAKTGGDVTKLKSMGLGERGVKALTGVSAIYKNAGGGKAGMDAINNEFKKYTTGVTEQEVSGAEKTVMGSSDKQMFVVMEQLKTSLGEALLPEFTKLAVVIRESTPVFVQLLHNGVPAFIDLIRTVSQFTQAHQGMISSMAAHPIGSILAYEVSKSMAAAGLGEAVKRMLDTQIGSKMGGAGLVVGTAMIAAQMGMIKIDAMAAADSKKVSDSIGGSTNAYSEAKGLQRDIASGKLTPEKAARLKALQSKLATQVENEKAGLNETSFGQATFGKIGDLFTGGETSRLGQETRQTNLNQSQQALDELNKALKMASENLKQLGGAAAGTAGGPSNSGPNGAGRSETLANR